MGETKKKINKVTILEENENEIKEKFETATQEFGNVLIQFAA